MADAMTVETTGLSELERVLNEAAEREEDMTEAFKEVARVFYVAEHQLFRNEGRTDGYGATSPWVKLSEPYRTDKANHEDYAGKGILELSGTLRKSLSYDNQPDSMFEVTKDSLFVGSMRLVKNRHGGLWNLGKLHSDGGRMIGGKPWLPRRPAIQVSDQQEEKWADAIEKSLWVEE